MSTGEPVSRYNRTIGTASQLATAVNAKLRELGIKHFSRATERTVRYYRTRRLIDGPYASEADMRKALFGELQLYQVALLLVLGARGHKLTKAKRMVDSIINRYHDGVDCTRAIETIRSIAKLESSVDEAIKGRNDIVT